MKVNDLLVELNIEHPAILLSMLSKRLALVWHTHFFIQKPVNYFWARHHTSLATALKHRLLDGVCILEREILIDIIQSLTVTIDHCTKKLGRKRGLLITALLRYCIALCMHRA